MLSRENDESQIGHTEEEVVAYFEEYGCPLYRPFVDALVRYAGLSYLTHGDEKSRVEFATLDGRVLRPRDRQLDAWKQAMGDDLWQLDFGGNRLAPGYDGMRPDGTIVLCCLKDDRLYPLASNIEIYLENDAMSWWLREHNFLVDGFDTSCYGAGTVVAEAFGLPPVAEATDEYVQWWWNGNIAVDCRKMIFAWFGERLSVRVLWSDETQEIPERLDEIIASFLEPHVLARRRRKRETSPRRLQDELSWDREYRPLPEEREAHSFRVFARIGLQRLHEKGMIDAPPPADKPLLQEYLENRITQWMAEGNTLATYYAAAGLVAFGHAEHIETLLSNMPRDAATSWPDPLWAAKYVRNLCVIQNCPISQTDQFLQRLRGDDKLAPCWDSERESYSWRAAPRSGPS